MTWYVVYYSNSGEAFSIGTVLADPMPIEFDVKTLTESEADILLNGTGVWNSVTLTVDLI